MINESNVVRIMDALVESFDMIEMGFTHAEPRSTGRKPYNPKDMLKIYIYGYFNGIRTSRKLEKECKRNIEQFSLVCDELKLFGKEIEQKGEISLTDPDARHMSVSNNGTDVSHNVQIAVDEKHHLVATVDVVSTPADQGQLHRMTEKAIEELDIEKNKDENRVTVLADKGYYTYEDLEKCKENQIKAIVPKQKSPSKTGYGEYSKDYFIYNKETNSYRCPQGEILFCKSSPSTKVKLYHNYEACQKCKYKGRCTKDEKGRKIRRSNQQDLFDEFDGIMKCNKELYKERQMIVEHPFGTVKRTLGYTFFLTRGNEGVKSESFVHFFIYNLKRVINIVGIKKLIEHLKLIYCYFLTFYKISKKTIVNEGVLTSLIACFHTV